MNIINLGSSSAGNAFIVESERDRILLECGFPYKQLQEKSGFNLPKHCLLTHEHGDHSKGAKDYIRWHGKLFCSAGTMETLNLDGLALQEKRQYLIAGFLVVPFGLIHNASEPFGYIIHHPGSLKTLLFIIDTHFTGYKFNRLPYKLTHLLVECNHDLEELSETENDGHLKNALDNHLSLQDLKELLNANNLKHVEQINLCHLSGSNLDPHKAKKEIQILTGLPVRMFSRNGGYF